MMMREYLIRHQMQASAPVPDPTDPDGWLLLDGLAELVASVRMAVQEPPGGRPVSRAGSAALQAAAHNVLGDLAGDLDELRAQGRDHLVFCPHGPLSYLPFALLPVNDKPLGQDWTITTVPSLGVLLTDPTPAASGQGKLGVLASPSGGAPYGLHVEPRLSEQAQQIRREVPGATVLDAGEATPEAARALLASSRYAHVAAHGSVLEQVPAFHCLYLDTDGEHDGRLYAHQLMRGDLRSLELVTLCACETALGRFDPAGNTRGLPQALLVAGVRTVVATLWPVRAQPAVEFFGSLHRNLHQGADRLTAFRTAQSESMARFPRYSDWGAFTYIGAWN
jgi:CHAT domain-containing protein